MNARETAQDVMVITSAGLSHTDDRKLRMRRYAITQGVRLICFVLAVALPVPLGVKLAFIVGAFTLPWFGVMAANAGPALVTRARPVPLVVTPTDSSRTIDQAP